MSRILDPLVGNPQMLPPEAPSDISVECTSLDDDEPLEELTYVPVPPRRSFTFLSRCTSVERGRPMHYPDPLEETPQ